MCNIFAITQGKQEEWSWFFACWKTLKISSNWYYHFRFVWQAISKLPKIISLVFFCKILRKNRVMIVYFLHTDKHGRFWLILWFLMRMVKHSQSSQNSKSAMSLQYLKKKFFLFFLTAIWLPLNQLRTII